MTGKVIISFLILAIALLWVKVMVLEDNMFKFNNAIKTLAGGLMELKRGGH